MVAELPSSEERTRSGNNTYHCSSQLFAQIVYFYILTYSDSRSRGFRIETQRKEEQS